MQSSEEGEGKTMTGANRITGRIFTHPTEGLGGDGLQIWGKDGPTILEKCVFDFRCVPAEEQDEAVDCIQGAKVRFYGCIFSNCKKAVLCGNGDYPAEDKVSGEFYFKDCVFINCGRRCPEAQDGVDVRMDHCWVHNWGCNAFDVRTFGARVSNGASLTAMECLFTRSKGIGVKNFFTDIANQIGEYVNENGIMNAIAHPLRASRPGTRRAVDAGKDGNAFIFSSWTNLAGLESLYAMPMDYKQVRKDVYKIIREIDESCLKNAIWRESMFETFTREVGTPWSWK